MTRIVRRRVRVRQPEEDKPWEIYNLLDHIVFAMDERDRLDNQIKQDMDALEREMKKYGLSVATTEVGIAEYVAPQGKTRNIINPRKMFDMVDEDAFFDAVTVSVTRAKEILTGRELRSVTTSVPPEIKEPVLTVIPKSKAKRWKGKI